LSAAATASTSRAIGAAVDLVARLERLADDFGCSVIASAEFVRDSGSDLTLLGCFALRGFATPQAVYGLPEQSEAGHDPPPTPDHRPWREPFADKTGRPSLLAIGATERRPRMLLEFLSYSFRPGRLE
jgi:hypothetical protein